MKIFRLIILNLLILFLILCIFEAVLYAYDKENNKKYNPDCKYHIGKIKYEYFLKSEIFRPALNTNFLKRPVIILGCSFAYGSFLEKEEDTMGYKLSQLTKRPVYNYAIVGKALQSALFIIQNKFYDTNIKNPEYVIYVMISDHIRRLYSNVSMSDWVGYPVYKLNKDGKLYMKSDYYPLYRQFYTFYYFNNLIYNIFIRKDFNRHNKYINAYFKAMNEEIKKQYPDIKFVILIYGDKYNFGLDLSELEEEGFIILQTEDLTGIDFNNGKYCISKDNKHPVKDVWNITVPALISRLGL